MLLAQIPVDLIKLLPDGANVVAVIVVVILFLKQQEKFNIILKNMTDDFHEQVKGNQKAFQDQITTLSEQYFSYQKLYQEQIQRLMDAHILVTREVITTLQEVKQNVSNINQKMIRYDEEENRRNYASQRGISEKS